MKKTFKKLLAAIATPFVALFVHIKTSREINEQGDWDKLSHERDVAYTKRKLVKTHQ